MVCLKILDIDALYEGEYYVSGLFCYIKSSNQESGLDAEGLITIEIKGRRKKILKRTP